MNKLFCFTISLAIVFSLAIPVFAKTSLEFEYGDVNIDGVIDLKDSLSLNKHIAGIENSDYNREASDINGDDTVDINDLLRLRQYLVDSSIALGPVMTARIALCNGVSSVAEGDASNISFNTTVNTGTVITFSGNGTYYLSGKMNGRIIVKYPSKSDIDKITIVLNGVDITCNTDCPIWIDKAEKTVITTINKTKNTLTDNSSTLTGVQNACIYSDDDLTVNGKGTLIINATGKNGIKCENDLKITKGNLEINADKNGLVGDTSVSYKDASTIIKCTGDAIKTTDETNIEKGFVEITSGEIYASCGDDVIQATRKITISECKIFYKFTATDLASCHKTKVGTTDSLGNAVIIGIENIQDGVFFDWIE